MSKRGRGRGRGRMNDFLWLIKQAAVDAVNAGRPMGVLYGTVLTEDPDLSIQIDQQMILTKEFLVKTRNVTDYYVDMTVDHITEDTDNPETSKMAGGGGDASFASHSHKHSHTHPYKGRKPFLVHNRLLVGEKVILLSVQGGQSYVILDRIGGENATAPDNG